MKKLLILLIAVFFWGCGDKVELTPENEKKELIKEVFDKKEKSISKYQKIIEKLNLQVKNGKKEALEELEKWKKIEEKERVNRMFMLTPEMEREANEFKKFFENLKIK